MGQDQHGTATRLGTQRPTPSRSRATWSLENSYICGGPSLNQVTAPCVFNGPINGECFLAYVEQNLLPCLRTGDIVIMDNLGSHKADAIRTAIRSVGARLLFLPPYSPDLNPIEQVFSKLKHTLRKHMGRTVEAVEHAIAQALPEITQTECKNYIVKCRICFSLR